MRSTVFRPEGDRSERYLTVTESNPTHRDARFVEFKDPGEGLLRRHTAYSAALNGLIETRDFLSFR